MGRHGVMGAVDYGDTDAGDGDGARKGLSGCSRELTKAREAVEQGQLAQPRKRTAEKIQPADGRFQKARTTTGSKCAPAEAASSFRAASAVIAVLYDRTAVIVS